MVHGPGDIERRTGGERRRQVFGWWKDGADRRNMTLDDRRRDGSSDYNDATGQAEFNRRKNNRIVERDDEVLEVDEYGRPHGQQYGEIKCFKVPTIGYRVWRPSGGHFNRPDGRYSNRRKGERRAYNGGGYMGIEQRKAVTDRRGRTLVIESKEEIAKRLLGQMGRQKERPDLMFNHFPARYRDAEDEARAELLAETEELRGLLRMVVHEISESMFEGLPPPEGSEGFEAACKALGLQRWCVDGHYGFREVL